ncbi:MAG: PAS domain S-box protein [Campylobacterales bacterium]|nr:PAS domain S-box protein [Campylobacterales bacterium]
MSIKNLNFLIGISLLSIVGVCGYLINTTYMFFTQQEQINTKAIEFSSRVTELNMETYDFIQNKEQHRYFLIKSRYKKLKKDIEKIESTNINTKLIEKTLEQYGAVLNEYYLLTIKSNQKNYFKKLQESQLIGLLNQLNQSVISYIEHNKELVKNRFEKMKYISLSLIFVSVMLFASTMIFIWRRVVVPIVHLSYMVKNKSVENKKNLIPSKNGDEIGVLIEAFNDYLSKQESSSKRLENAYLELDAQYVETQKNMMLYIEEKEKFQSLMEYSSDGVLILSCENGKILDLSNQIAVLLRYTKSELLSLSVMDWDLDIKKIEDYQDLISDVEIGIPKFVERTHTRKDGTTYIAAISAVRIKIQEKEVIYASVRDITNEKRQNLALTALKNTLDNAVSIANLGSWEWDSINDVTTWSDITYDIYGLEKGTDINLQVIESLIYEKDLSKHQREVINTLEKNVPFDFEYRIIRKNHIRTIHAIGNPIEKDGVVVKMVGVVQDVTDLKENERKLLRAQKVAKLGIFEEDLIENKEAWSGEFFNILGLDKTKVKPSSDSFTQVVHPDDRKKIKTKYETLLRDKKPSKIRVRLVMNNQSIKWVEIQCEVKLGDNGIPAKVIGTMIDVTSDVLLQETLGVLNENLEKKVEEEVKKVESLQKENFLNQKKAAMGDLIGIIAHQLKQPLSAISLGSETILDSYQFNDLTEEDLSEITEDITSQVKFMADSIDDLRNFFRPDKKSLPFSLKKSIEKSLAIVEKNINSKGIEIIKEFKADCKVLGIDSELQQVIINIVSNGKDALEKIESEDKFIRVSCQTIEENGVIEIEDNGGGIDEGVIEKIFDSYFTTKGDMGTGIGLNLSKMIIENSMGGKLMVQNGDKGAIFTISLPYLH